MKALSDEVDMILILEVAVAAIAAILSVVSLFTLRAIKHLGVGKSFWMPASAAGVFFMIGSVFAIFRELNFSLPLLTAYTDEVIQFSRFFALCALAGSVFSYSRQVSKNLPEKPIAQKKTVAPIVQVAPARSHIHERLIKESQKKQTATECKYQFGYLRTLPKDASIPDECLSCDRIIQCKHSQPRTLETRVSSPS